MNICVILAAGQGKRMLSDLPKVMHPVLGRPMIDRVIDTARKAGIDDVVAVIGHGRETVIPLLESRSVSWEIQEQQLGTAHALRVGLKGRKQYDEVTVLLGDVPLLKPETVCRLIESRRTEKAAIAVLTSFPDNPSGYGRVVTDGIRIQKIVEERETTEEEKQIREVNTGIMAFDGYLLGKLLKEITNQNSQGEYYLTDTTEIVRGYDSESIAVRVDNWSEVAGVNNRLQLAEATEVLKRQVLERLMIGGIAFPDPWSCWVEDTVRIGQGSLIGRICRLSGSTVIGENAVIGDGSILIDAYVPPGSKILPYTFMEGESC